jgi:hypothetical protein
MASIAFTKVADSEDVWGKHRVNYWTMVLSATTYAAGGFAVTAAQFGLRNILSLEEVGTPVLPSTTSDYKLTYNSGTGKIQLFGGAASTVALAEAANGSLTLTKTIRVMSTDD